MQDSTIATIEFARARLGGCDDDLIRTIAQTLITESADRILELEQALAIGDAAIAARAAHTLKGAAAIFDATSVMDSSEKIERLARQEDLVPVSQQLPELKDSVKLMTSALQEFLTHGS